VRVFPSDTSPVEDNHHPQFWPTVAPQAAHHRSFAPVPDFPLWETDLPDSSGRRGPFRLKFGWPVVAHRNLDHRRRQPQSSASANPASSTASICATSGTRGARKRRGCFRARFRGHRARGSCPNYQPLKRPTLHVGSKHAEIVSKQAEILPKPAQKLGQILTSR